MSNIPTNKPPLVAPVSVPEGHGPISPRTQWACPRCGSTDLASTYLVDYSDNFGNVYLAPKGLRLRKLRRLFRPFKALTVVYADTCRNCGMVILEVNTEDLAEAERRFGRR
ncbi:MAG: hypothetical protein F9K27_12920 [Anaerolineae bacterium]|nr:MAG: hypothetical protein F9K27_12920 [Anaerolineae bacterium]